MGPADFDVVVVGGGPAGATAANELARSGKTVLLLDRCGRTKPCGGAIPTRLIEDFAIPDHLLKARIRAARIVAPSRSSVDMHIRSGHVGMVDRESFDGWLRQRAGASGADVRAATFKNAHRSGDRLEVSFEGSDRQRVSVKTRLLIGADGASSAVRRLRFGYRKRPRYVVAYHEIIKSPPVTHPTFDGQRCDVYYQAGISPDFYGWVFPHGDTTSVGTGSAVKGFNLRSATRDLRAAAGLSDQETLVAEGAPLPMKPLRRWDNGADTLLIGDAAGVVAPSSGEGIYYAMLSGRIAAATAAEFLVTHRAGALKSARRRFMREHGRVFLILGLMQRFWYRTDRRRERFVAICGDPDVQHLVWDSYLNKRLKMADPLAHVRVFVKDLGHLMRLALDRL